MDAVEASTELPSGMKKGVWITCLYFLTFALALGIQAVPKVQKAERIRKEKDYNRYKDEDMLIVDRIVGNQLEWMPMFLCLFWLDCFTSGFDSVSMFCGYVYVFSRLLYPFLALGGGISKKGVHGKIFIATVPGYISLTIMLIRLFWFSLS